MWKNFQKVLEKRVKKSQKDGFLLDKFMIIKTAQECILSEYGREGLKNIEINLSKKEDYLILRCPKSTWRSELKLNNNKIVRQINNKLKTNSIKGCFLRQF